MVETSIYLENIINKEIFPLEKLSIFLKSLRRVCEVTIINTNY